MRELGVFESISVDGFFCDDHSDMSWAHGNDDAEFSAWVAGNAGGGGALLFGRKTYEMMASFWPTPMAAQLMPEVARGMNAAEKYVVSSSLEPTWQNTRRLGGDLVASIQALKAGEGSPITILGSGSLVAQLSSSGLVDVFTFVTVPIALGAGRGVFSDRQVLRLESQRGFSCGKVVARYRVDR